MHLCLKAASLSMTVDMRTSTCRPRSYAYSYLLGTAPARTDRNRKHDQKVYRHSLHACKCNRALTHSTQPLHCACPESDRDIPHAAMYGANVLNTLQTHSTSRAAREIFALVGYCRDLLQILHLLKSHLKSLASICLCRGPMNLPQRKNLSISRRGKMHYTGFLMPPNVMVRRRAGARSHLLVDSSSC